MSRNFTCRISHEEGWPTAYLQGELDMAAAPTAENALADVLAERPESLVIDLTDVSFMDSRGLSVLLHAQAAAGEVTLRGASGRVRELFMLAGVDQAFRLEPTA
jgi:anti-anti-sigma factor